MKENKPPKFPEHGEAREYWREVFAQRKGVPYAWGIKEGMRLNEILGKIREIAPDDEPLTVFKQIIDNYPAWWLTRQYSLHALSTHFNAIVSYIKNNGKTAKQTGVSDNYLADLARRAAGE